MMMMMEKEDCKNVVNKNSTVGFRAGFNPRERSLHLLSAVPLINFDFKENLALSSCVFDYASPHNKFSTLTIIF